MSIVLQTLLCVEDCERAGLNAHALSVYYRGRERYGKHAVGRSATYARLRTCAKSGYIENVYEGHPHTNAHNWRLTPLGKQMLDASGGDTRP